MIVKRTNVFNDVNTTASIRMIFSPQGHVGITQQLPFPAKATGLERKARPRNTSLTNRWPPDPGFSFENLKGGTTLKDYKWKSAKEKQRRPRIGRKDELLVTGDEAEADRSRTANRVWNSGLNETPFWLTLEEAEKGRSPTLIWGQTWELRVCLSTGFC